MRVKLKQSYSTGYKDGVLAASMHLAKESDRHGRRAQRALRLMQIRREMGDRAKLKSAEAKFDRALSRRGECVRCMLSLRSLEDAARKQCYENN